jgi:hypothetical protein
MKNDAGNSAGTCEKVSELSSGMVFPQKELSELNCEATAISAPNLVSIPNS